MLILMLCKFNASMIAYIKKLSPLLDFLLTQYSIDVQPIEKIIMVI